MIGAKWFDMNARTREAMLLATVRPVLARLDVDEEMSTSELFAQITVATEGGATLSSYQVKALYRALTQLAKHHPELADRCEPQAGRGLMRGKTVRPWLWHRPEERAEVKRCPHCGGEL